MDKAQMKHLKDDLYCKNENLTNFMRYIKNLSQTSSHHTMSDDDLEQEIIFDIKRAAGDLGYASLATLQMHPVIFSHGLIAINPVNVSEPYCVAVFYQPS